MFKFSLKNVFRRKWITVLAIIGTGLGCGLMTALLSLSDGMDQKLTETLNEVAGDIIVSPESAPFGISLSGGVSSLPISYIDEFEKMPHVKDVIPTAIALIPNKDLTTLNPLGITLTGIDINKDTAHDGPTANIIQGRTIQADNEVIVGERLIEFAERKKITIFNVGSIIEAPKGLSGLSTSLMNPSGGMDTVPTMPEVPIQEPPTDTQSDSAQEQLVDIEAFQKLEIIELKIVGIFSTDSIMDDMNIFGDINTVREISGLGQDQVNNITVVADNSDNVTELAEQIKDKFKDGEVPISTIVAKDILGEINETMDIFRAFLLALSLIAAAAGGMAILIVMLLSTMERRGEFGILKASGWSNSNIIYSVLIESFVLSIIGVAIGFSFGYIVIVIARATIVSGIGVITITLFLKVLAFGLVMGIVGGIYPAWRASKVSPIETLKAL